MVDLDPFNHANPAATHSRILFVVATAVLGTGEGV